MSPDINVSYGEARDMSVDEIAIGLVQVARAINARPKSPPPKKGGRHG